MRHTLLTLVVAIAATASSFAQSGPPRFQHERGADVAGGEQHRLDVDVALLQGSQPFRIDRFGDRFIASGGLNDLRLFSASGQDVPYLLAPPPLYPARTIAGRVLPITATDLPNAKASGFEVDFDTVTTMDAIDLGGIPAPFLKRFRLEASGDRTRWTQLIAEGTAFNLPAERLVQTSIEFEPGDYRFVRVTWDDTNSARVPAPDRVMARGAVPLAPVAILRTPVVISARPSEPGRSRFRVTLPAARLPIVALELTVGGGHLSRDASVLEASLVGGEAQPAILGSAKLVRVVRDDVAADALRIPIRQPTEAQLDLVVDNGDNPPLALEGVTAVFAELPWIYFEAPPGSIVARWGDPRLAAPRYDLEAVRNTHPSLIARAAWRAEPARTLVVEPEGLPLPEVGSALNTDGFESVREIPQGAAGLITLPLDAAVMSRSGVAPRRLADLRIVDGSSRQVPYLLEKRDEPLIVDVVIERRDLPATVERPSGSITSYVVRLPYRQLPDARLVLTTASRVFTRTLSLGSIVPPAERRPARLLTHGSATWLHADQSRPASAITFPLPASLDGDLFLLVEEGDNQPLPIQKATIMMPSYAVRLFRPADQPLRLVYGKDRVEAPRYDLQLLAPQMMGRIAEEVALGPERAAGGATTATSGIQVVHPAVFWSALSLAVLVLLGLVAKLMRREAL